ncbi:CinA family protein [Accumulibacter sp.]|uniref:CinA family protein n=1 Tax=Accumulibacter sp. TaxID=2053492 RepID=UPI0025EB1CF3|nr:CinA family protein [Accumulibacter sp.]MCM8593837.1 CinA family protein [Accumulibacter sp.]MCM8626121.1 CinA family protein [Accumulibacter sp.]MDS4047978.1 CinA family protein [Accumulibacter sp.]
MSAVEQAALEALAARAGRVLRDAGARLATAESCTGGWVGQCLTAIPGSSEWFDRGFITYSNEAKVELLDVSADLLRRQGAVSEATAAAMVLGALAHSRADWALAITGVAGPAGGSPGRPVGTVCFAWAGREGAVDTLTRHFSGHREAIRAQSVACALEGLVERVGRCLA